MDNIKHITIDRVLKKLDDLYIEEYKYKDILINELIHDIIQQWIGAGDACYRNSNYHKHNVIPFNMVKSHAEQVLHITIFPITSDKKRLLVNKHKYIQQWKNS